MVNVSRTALAYKLMTRPFVPPFANESEFADIAGISPIPFNGYFAKDGPDRTNACIADITAYFARRFPDVPIYAQREQVNILHSEFMDRISTFDSEDGARVQSQLLVAWQARQILRLRKGNKILRIGIPEHLGRVVALDEYYGLDPRIPRECRSIPFDPRVRPGMQDWCVSREKFISYEWPKARIGSAGMVLLGMFPKPERRV